MAIRIPETVLSDTFGRLRNCGGGRRECQALWLAERDKPDQISRVIHPSHSASAVGFEVDPDWLTGLWRELAYTKQMIRAQIHTHPGAAYHSATDDAFPMLSVPGFLSLVIPRFAQGAIGFEAAFLAEIDADGRWNEVDIGEYLEIIS